MVSVCNNNNNTKSVIQINYDCVDTAQIAKKTFVDAQADGCKFRSDVKIEWLKFNNIHITTLMGASVIRGWFVTFGSIWKQPMRNAKQYDPNT